MGLPDDYVASDARKSSRYVCGNSRSLLASLIVWAVAATGDYWYGSQQCNASAQTPCAADNLEHTFCWGDSFDSDNLRDGARGAMDNLADQTRFTRDHLLFCGQNTDLVFRKFNDPDARGRYDCVDTSGVAGPGCQKAIVYLNPDLLDDDNNRRKTSCHEIGHSGGLVHADDSNDCMKSGPVYSGHRTYGDHHIDHLNNNPA